MKLLEYSLVYEDNVQMFTTPRLYSKFETGWLMAQLSGSTALCIVSAPLSYVR